MRSSSSVTCKERTMGIYRKVAHALSVMVLVTMMLFMFGAFDAGPASAAVNGTVECIPGTTTWSVVGIWVESSNSAHSGWAGWTPVSGQPWKASYSKSQVASNESYRLHVGCGGDPYTWRSTSYTPWTTGNQNFLCDPAHSSCSS